MYEVDTKTVSYVSFFQKLLTDKDKHEGKGKNDNRILKLKICERGAGGSEEGDEGTKGIKEGKDEVMNIEVFG
jgi:hypothetical protein